MFLQKSCCILCGEHIDKIRYNLKTTYSDTSNVLLIKFVEKIYKNVFLMHCNICCFCYELLNELDNVQTREKKLYATLKNYVAKMQDPSSKLNSTTNEDTPESHEDIPVFAELANDDIGSNEVPSSDSEIFKIEDIDLKKLPIKVKRITNNTQNKGSIYETILNSKSKSSKHINEDQEAFEKIQSSIQMDLSKHVQEHMKKYKPTKDVLCEVCGQNFKTKVGFENHVKKHGDAEDDMKILIMNKKDENWDCNICGKIFTHKAALNRHLFIHTGETRYQCEECGKKFVHHSSFNMHKKIHAGQRNFVCLKCNKGFLTRSHLKRHMRAAHNFEKNHSCDYCGKRFAEKYNLAAHIKVVHKLHEPKDNLVVQDEIFYEGKEESDAEVYYAV